jgi:hypothetical protein
MSRNTRNMKHRICKERGLTGIFYMLRNVKVSCPFSFRQIQNCLAVKGQNS